MSRWLFVNADLPPFADVVGPFIARDPIYLAVAPRCFRVGRLGVSRMPGKLGRTCLSFLRCEVSLGEERAAELPFHGTGSATERTLQRRSEG